MSWTRMTGPVRRWGTHELFGASHAWEELPNGRWSTVCDAFPERWSCPYQERVRQPRCSNCERFTAASLDGDVGRVLGSRWPRAMTYSEIRRAVKGDLGYRTAIVSLGRLEKAGLIYADQYGKRGHARYSAGRRLVESVGRNYGMM